MKRVLLRMLILFSMCAGFTAHAEEKKYFELGVAPVNPKRMVDWTGGECILRLAYDEKATISMRGGKTATAWLRAGEVIVIDRESGEAKWVLRCGNGIVEPKDWKPRGDIDYGPSGPKKEGYVERSTAYLPKAPEGGTWTMVDSGRPQRTVRRKDPNKKWYWVAAGIFAVGVAGAYCSAEDCFSGGGGGGGGSSDPPGGGGGPGPDPPS